MGRYVSKETVHFPASSWEIRYLGQREHRILLRRHAGLIGSRGAFGDGLSSSVLCLLAVPHCAGKAQPITPKSLAREANMFKQLLIGALILGFFAFGNAWAQQTGPVGRICDPCDQEELRKDMIVNSYWYAFGRWPSDGELRYWLSQPANDRRMTNLESLIANHLNWLRSAPAEQRQTAKRALHEALKSVAGIDREPVVKNAVVDMMAGREGGGFRGLVAYLRKPEVHRYYGELARRAGVSPTPSVPHPSNQVVAIGQSNTPRKDEYCFGAVGKGCLGDGNREWGWGSQKIVVPVGCSQEVNDFRNCWVVPGSIKHDNCCVFHPSGKMCGGPGTDGKPADENNHDGNCVAEWNDAYWDVFWHRAWLETFDVRRPADLTQVSSPRIAWGREAVGTAGLCAPDGFELRDQKDESFCCSGRAVNKVCRSNARSVQGLTPTKLIGDPTQVLPPPPSQSATSAPKGRGAPKGRPGTSRAVGG
jgi:hypothetical protein